MTTRNKDQTSHKQQSITAKILPQVSEVEELKENILKKEEKKVYSSERFSKIEAQVRQNLKTQNADAALRDLTIGALFLGVSDIHYEYYETEVMIRFRIDGILVEIFSLTKAEYKLMLERLKYSSGLKLNITTIPQDGKYDLEIEGRKIDIRVSTLPVLDSENVVTRLLDGNSTTLDFQNLGFFWTTKRILKKTMEQKNGLILVTGPTGSGKTTTLYTILNALNTPDKKLITLEDPIEYQVEGIIQSEVDEKKGYSFKSGLRALLRQDPDIIMVGEIRDYETLEISTEASLTGHLVLSTLHTKSAAETLDRIVNMGLKPYIIASALDTIIAQRLVRRICPHCKREREKTESEAALISEMLDDLGMGSILEKSVKLYEGSGCSKCNHTGYLGRIGIYEIIRLTEPLRQIIREGATAKQIIEEARNSDYINMKEDGILKAIRGYTTIEEILRVI